MALKIGLDEGQTLGIVSAAKCLEGFHGEGFIFAALDFLDQPLAALGNVAPFRQRKRSPPQFPVIGGQRGLQYRDCGLRVDSGRQAWPHPTGRDRLPAATTWARMSPACSGKFSLSSVMDSLRTAKSWWAVADLSAGISASSIFFSASRPTLRTVIFLSTAASRKRGSDSGRLMFFKADRAWIRVCSSGDDANRTRSG